MNYRFKGYKVKFQEYTDRWFYAEPVFETKEGAYRYAHSFFGGNYGDACPFRKYSVEEFWEAVEGNSDPLPTPKTENVKHNPKSEGEKANETAPRLAKRQPRND